jgi:hypothetical protein
MKIENNFDFARAYDISFIIVWCEMRYKPASACKFFLDEINSEDKKSGEV